ncbi:MAG: DUF4382 domain-containing protein [Candidatus Marinimicrobia bacterium]|nr:DUF4382 domain-containing protein [Candidatus Neomarinimicrobiota bacterium]
MSKQSTNITILALSFIITMGLNGCSNPTEDDTGNLSGDETGTLSVLLTDTPFPTDLVAEANVTIVKIEARAAGGNEGSPYITLSEDSQTYNLLDLRNGVTAGLAELEVPAGSYDLFRLYISDGSVVLKDGPTYNLTVPSGAQTGLKLFVSPAIEVVSGLTSDLLLDFDVEKSFVLQGNRDSIGGFIFKPVIRATNASTVGRISGTVADTAAVALNNATVWVAQDTVVSTTYTGADGSYTILGLPAGSYSTYATLAGYDTVSVEVTVVAGSQSAAEFELTPQ